MSANCQVNLCIFWIWWLYQNGLLWTAFHFKTVKSKTPQQDFYVGENMKNIYNYGWLCGCRPLNHFDSGLSPPCARTHTHTHTHRNKHFLSMTERAMETLLLFSTFLRCQPGPALLFCIGHKIPINFNLTWVRSGHSRYVSLCLSVSVGCWTFCHLQ